MRIFFKRKKTVNFLVIFILFTCFLFFPIFVSANDLNFVPEEVLIRFKNSNEIQKIDNINNLSLKKIEEINKNSLEIDWIEPNYSFKTSYVPNDPYYREQWYLDKIKAPQAWDLTRKEDNEIVVAILDTGVDINHPDLKDNVWVNKDEIKGDGIDNDNNGYVDDVNGWDFVKGISDPKPKFDNDYTESGIHHGTLVAGIAASVGNNSEGTTGVAWNAKIMPLRVLSGKGTGSVEHVIQAVNYAVENGADVINLSFVGTDKSYFLLETLKQAWDKGVIIVAAAGNETEKEPVNLNSEPNYPICLDEDEIDNFIIGVAAVDDDDEKALFSDYGSNCVDICAPGTRIYGPLTYNPHYGFKEYYGGYWSGTSISAPIVSGLAALVKSINPLFSHKQVQDFILAMADNIDYQNPDYADHLGKGRVNAYQTVDYARTQLGATDQSHYIVTGAGKTGGPHVRVFDSAGLSITGFFAYHQDFMGGVNVSAGDVEGDGEEEIVTGAGETGGPHVRIFDISGNPKGGFFAYQENFRGGVNVAVGDVDGDGIDEIVTGAGPGGGPHVRIFDISGNPKGGFFAYQENFRGGVNVAVGDVDGDGIDEIVTGAGETGGPHVRVFDNQGNIKFHFFAYNKDFRGGVSVAVGDIDGNGKSEIITGVATGASSYIRVFDSEFLLLKLQFLAYDKDFYQGVNLAVADFNKNNKVEIVTSPKKGIEPQLKVFDFSGNQLSQFYSYSRLFKGGVNITTIKAN